MSDNPLWMPSFHRTIHVSLQGNLLTSCSPSSPAPCHQSCHQHWNVVLLRLACQVALRLSVQFLQWRHRLQKTRQPLCPTQRYIFDLPLNIEPTAPCLSKMLVPVPCVFSPAAGCLKISIRAYQYRAEKAYSLLNRFVKTASHLIFFESRVGTLLKGLGCIVTVHYEFASIKVLVKRP